jgi:hypothetical protein
MIPPKQTLIDVIDFCTEYNIPYIGRHITLYESYYEHMHDKHNDAEIWKTWKDSLRAYWDPQLIYNLNKFKTKEGR